MGHYYQLYRNKKDYKWILRIHANKLKNSDKVDKFLEKHKLLKLTLVTAFHKKNQAQMVLLVKSIKQFSSVQLLSHVRLFATPWIAARQASLSITNSWSSLKLTSIESVMPSSHLILCRPLLLLPAVPPSIRVFSNVSTLRMRWPKYWSFRFRKV